MAYNKITPNNNFITMLTDEQVKKFQDIYRKRFGKEISKEDALEKGIKQVRLMEIIYRPITENDLKMLKKRRREIKDKLASKQQI